MLIEVSFKGNRKDFFLWDGDEPPPLQSAVIVDADRGEDLGVVHAAGEAAEHRNSGVPHGYGRAGTTKKARRLATPDEVKKAAELREQNEDARRKASERVRANALVMKLSDAEWQWDRKKLTFYFTAEKRVDFRTLVRELASMFRTRIELKQIGVRDEAKRLDGIGRCGRQYCSSSWLPELRPVNLGVAKDQRLSLNPSQISGACGRLMCCLRYEHEFYVLSRKRFPKEGRLVRTKRGDEKVIANDIFRERVTLRGEDGELRTLTLVELHDEAAEAGAPLALPLSAMAPTAVEDARHRGAAAGVADDESLDDTADAIDAEDSDEEAVSVDASAEPDAESDAEPDAEPDAETTTEGAADSPERRPHRRRGRRGGRRNRQGGRGRGDGAPGDADGTGSSGGTP